VQFLSFLSEHHKLLLVIGGGAVSVILWVSSIDQTTKANSTGLEKVSTIVVDLSDRQDADERLHVQQAETAAIQAAAATQTAKAVDALTDAALAETRAKDVRKALCKELGVKKGECPTLDELPQ
jgi:hypothetical protein